MTAPPITATCPRALGPDLRHIWGAGTTETEDDDGQPIKRVDYVTLRPMRTTEGRGMIGSRVLVLAPHTDDAELGCGGTMAKLREQGATVTVAVVADAGQPDGASTDCLRAECVAAMEVLGCAVRFGGFPARDLPRQAVLDWLLTMGRDVAPDAVLLPSSADTHQDHQVVYAEGLRAFKDCTIWGYELPWNHIEFRATGYVTLTADQLALKWAALCAYRSQARRPYFDYGFVHGLARVRGVQVKAELAEAFEVVRVRW
jgi:LmbE family N-acetylglucosaminyl deacetylase